MMKIKDYQETRQETLEMLKSGDALGAFSRFRRVIEYPNCPEEKTWKDDFALFRQIAEAIAGPDFAHHIQQVADYPSNVKVLYDASYQLYEERLHGIAATLLDRANKISPKQSAIVTELSSNFEALMLNNHAVEVIQKSGLAEHDPLCTYLLAFNLLMMGKPQESLSLLPKIEAASDSDVSFMARSLRSMLERTKVLEAVTKLDDLDLTGWHMVLNGDLLLHESPFGFEDAMRGRYAYISDSFGLIREGIERVKSVIEHFSISPENVIAAPDRSSQIISKAAALILDLPYEDWREERFRQGLVVVYDLDLIEDAQFLTSLKIHVPGQLLWTHAGCWTEPFPLAPDLTTMQHQSCHSPWGGGAMRVDPKTRELTRAEADTSPVDEIAQRIVDAEIKDKSHRQSQDLLSILEAVKPLGNESNAGLFRSSGSRYRQRKGSPVKSNRFL